MCREHGIDAAFERNAAEDALDQLVMTFLNTRDMGELKAFVVGHATELLAPQADRVFRQLAIQYRDDVAIIGFLEERRQLLANCRDHGIDSAFSENIIEVSEALGNAVAAFLQTTSNAQLLTILTRDGHNLLTDQAEQLVSFIQSGIAASDSERAAHLSRRLALLRRCRLYGVEAALDVAPIASTLGLQPVEGDDPRPGSVEQSAVLAEELRALGEADGSVDEAAMKALLERRPELADALFQAIERGGIQWTPPADRGSLETMIADMRAAELSGDWDRVVASGTLALQYSAVDHDPRAATMVHSTLGTALSKTQHGDRAANLDRAIHHHRQARAGLQVGESDPERAFWAMNEHHLALALFQRVRGDRAQNVEDAIEVWRGLLAAAGSAAQAEWKVSLAEALRMRHLGDRVKNIAEAIELLSAVLAAAESEGDQTILARARVALGLVWLVRPDGDPAAKVERAIEYIVSGLTHIDLQSDIASWANVQRSLARAYTQRVFGDTAENWRIAAEILDKVAAACPADQYPELWAEARLEMAALLSNGPQGGTVEKTHGAVRAMESALRVYTRAGFPDRWAKVHCNIGSMLVSLFEATEDGELFDRARHHTELSLTVNSREGSPERWAMAHQVLGRLHTRRAELSEGASRDEAASVALQHFERALEARTITVDPAGRLDTLKCAAAILFRHRAWDEALALYVDAMRTSDQLLGAAFTEDARLAGVSPDTGLYRSAAYCLEKLNDPTAALICLDWGKGRMLAEALAVQDLDRFHLAAAERDEIAVLRGEVRRLEYVMRSAGNAPPQEYSELSEALSSARAALNQTVAAATMASDLFNQTRLTTEQLFGSVPATGALVVPLLTAVGTTVFLLVRTKAGELEIIRLALDDDTSTILRILVRGGPDSPGWWDQYNAWRRGEISASAWGETIASTMDALWKLVLQPVVETLDSRLPPDALVIIAPQGDLAFLPFHAAGAADHGQVGLLDRFTVAYTPSLYALHACQQRLAARGKTKMKVVAAVNPTRDLPFSDAEADDLGVILPPTRPKRRFKPLSAARPICISPAMGNTTP